MKRGLRGQTLFYTAVACFIALFLMINLYMSFSFNSTCSFDYNGALRDSDLNCFIQYFEFASPVEIPLSSNMSHTLKGITWIEGPAPVPIFILFRDRVSVLIEVIRSLHRHIKTPFEIVIYNDRTSFPAANKFLMRLEASGIKVHNGVSSWDNFDQLYAMLTDFIERYMASSRSDFYVLTDPDCALDSAPWNILDVYQGALVKLNITAVGASIRWDDWSDVVWSSGYETSIMNAPIGTVTVRGRRYHFINAPVDTTFAMYKKGPRPIRLQGKYVRMLPPLGVRHLDFYLETNVPPDYKYYHSHSFASQVNHMSHILGPTDTSGIDNEWCNSMLKKYAVEPSRSWGMLHQSLQLKWKAGACDQYFVVPERPKLHVPYCNNSGNQSKDLIAVMAATTTRNILNPAPERLSLFNTLLPSLMRSIECRYKYVFVMGFDAGDPYYDTDEGMGNVLEWFSENVQKIMANNGIELTILPVRVDNLLKKPGPVFIEMARRAFESKSEYFFRVNDDTEFVTRWPSSLVRALDSISGRVGVVGPICKQGNEQILTHDFVHRTHMEIFEKNYYPPDLVDWWMDDWISFVYGESRTFRVSSVEVVHTGVHGTRYEVNFTNAAKVERLVKEGRTKIRRWFVLNKMDKSLIRRFENDRFQTIGGTFPLISWTSRVA